MSHAVHSLPTRTGLALLVACTLALVAALALAPRASAWYCPPGTHEFPPDSGQCVPDKPTPTTPEAPPVPPPTQPEQPPPKPEQPHQPTPPQAPPAAPAPQSPPTAVPAPAPQPPAPQPQPQPAAPPAPAPAPQEAVQQEVQAEAEEEVTRPRRERPSSAVGGEVAEESAPVAPQPTQRPPQLPFTGVDAAVIALMGIAFLGAGLLLRRRRAASPRGEIVAAVPGRLKGVG